MVYNSINYHKEYDPTMTHEFDTFTDDVEIPEHDRGIARNDPGPSTTEIERLQRRELALRATDAISEVLEVDVTMRALGRLADTSEAPDVRLAAVRALRCVESIGREDSAVIALFGEKGIYHYVEGVIQYGASEKYFLALAEAHELDAEAVTSLYELREQVAQYTNGRKPGFKTMHTALQRLGITPRAAAADPDAAVTAMYEAGYFIDHVGNSEYSRIFDQPIFAPHLGEDAGRLVEDDADGTFTRGIIEGFRAYFDRHPEEVED